MWWNLRIGMIVYTLCNVTCNKGEDVGSSNSGLVESHHIPVYDRKNAGLFQVILPEFPIQNQAFPILNITTLPYQSSQLHGWKIPQHFDHPMDFSHENPIDFDIDSINKLQSRRKIHFMDYSWLIIISTKWMFEKMEKKTRYRRSSASACKLFSQSCRSDSSTKGRTWPFCCRRGWTQFWPYSGGENMAKQLRFKAWDCCWKPIFRQPNMMVCLYQH